MATILETSLLIIFILLSSITSFILIRKGLKEKDKSLTTLGFGFLFLIIFSLFDGLKLLPYDSISDSLELVILLLLCVFTKYTFYQDKKNLYPKILGFVIFVGVYTIVSSLLIDMGVLDFLSNNESFLLADNVIMLLWTVVPFGWVMISAHKARIGLEKQDVEPWITKRLLLVEIYSFFTAIVSLPDLIDSLADYQITSQMESLQFLIMLIFVTLSFLAWYMPDSLKKRLNRNYEATIKEEEKEIAELSEEDILNQLTEVYTS